MIFNKHCYSDISTRQAELMTADTASALAAASPNKIDHKSIELNGQAELMME